MRVTHLRLRLPRWGVFIAIHVILDFGYDVPDTPQTN